MGVELKEAEVVEKEGLNSKVWRPPFPAADAIMNLNFLLSL